MGEVELDFTRAPGIPFASIQIRNSGVGRQIEQYAIGVVAAPVLRGVFDALARCPQAVVVFFADQAVPPDHYFIRHTGAGGTWTGVVSVRPLACPRDGHV